MIDDRYVITRMIEDKVAIAKSIGQYEMPVSIDIMEILLGRLKEEWEPKLVNNICLRKLDTIGDCPSCGVGLNKRSHPIYCGLCGQRLKWYETNEIYNIKEGDV